MSPDIADLLALLIALAAYADKQLDIRARIRRLRKTGLPDTPAAETTDQPEGAPAT